jgi:hypothetical protein
LTIKKEHNMAYVVTVPLDWGKTLYLCQRHADRLRAAVDAGEYEDLNVGTLSDRAAAHMKTLREVGKLNTSDGYSDILVRVSSRGVLANRDFVAGAVFYHVKGDRVTAEDAADFDAKRGDKLFDLVSLDDGEVYHLMDLHSPEKSNAVSRMQTTGVSRHQNARIIQIDADLYLQATKNIPEGASIVLFAPTAPLSKPSSDEEWDDEDDEYTQYYIDEKTPKKRARIESHKCPPSRVVYKYLLPGTRNPFIQRRDLRRLR